MNLPYFEGAPLEIIKAGDEDHVIFEPPPLDSMLQADHTPGFLYYLMTHGNPKANQTIDKVCLENADLVVKHDTFTMHYNKTEYGDNPYSILDLLNFEKEASNIDFAEALFAKKIYKEVKSKTSELEQEIQQIHNDKKELKAKIKELKEKLNK